MHKSAYEIGRKFLDRYWSEGMRSILEVGSLDVNGTLKDFQPEGAEWIGVDLEAGKGVDVVIEKSAPLPFEDCSFDLIVATSIFEHDPMFWMTFNEMLRVTRDGGFIFISAPSNGWVHRYPLDVYRFYPDAGVALEDWGHKLRPNLKLQESFISERDGDVWNDFIAVFSLTDKNHANKIYKDTPSTNIWDGGVFVQESLSEATEDMRIIKELQLSQNGQKSSDFPNNSELEELKNLNQDLKDLLQAAKEENLQTLARLENVESRSRVLENEVNTLTNELLVIQKSRSWKITKPLRKLLNLARRGKKLWN